MSCTAGSDGWSVVPIVARETECCPVPSVGTLWGHHLVGVRVRLLNNLCLRVMVRYPDPAALAEPKEEIWPCSDFCSSSLIRASDSHPSISLMSGQEPLGSGSYELSEQLFVVNN